MDPREIEGMLSRISGVKAVRVVGDGDSIKEIHVVSNGDKPPKQVVRDIETTIFAFTGIKIDRKVISVAQIEDTAFKRKFELEGLEVDERGFEIEVSVRINADGEIFEGESSGPRTSKRRLLVVGEAIVNAVKPDGKAISVDDVRTILLNDREYVVSLLSVFDGKREYEVIGVSKNENGLRSVAESILDALEKVI